MDFLITLAVGTIAAALLGLLGLTVSSRRADNPNTPQASPDSLAGATEAGTDATRAARPHPRDSDVRSERAAPRSRGPSSWSVIAAALILGGSLLVHGCLPRYEQEGRYTFDRWTGEVCDRSRCWNPRAQPRGR